MPNNLTKIHIIIKKYESDLNFLSMKSIFTFLSILFILLGFAQNIYSQDIIILRTGDEISSIVTEIDAVTIKYKKFENPTGPIYSIEKSGVFMIKYENGSKEVFEQTIPKTNRESGANVGNKSNSGKLEYIKYGVIKENDEVLTPDELLSKYSNCPEALASYNRGRKLIKIGNVTGYAGAISSLGFGLLSKNPSLTSTAVVVVFSSASLITSITTTVAGRKKIKKSVEIYNSQAFPKLE
jgi:hypothetical protein